jgi:ATP-binding cassette subfamily B protein
VAPTAACCPGAGYSRVWQAARLPETPLLSFADRRAARMRKDRIMPLRRYWTLLRHYLRPHWVKLLMLALLLGGDIGLQLVNPQILRFFIDTARTGGAMRRLSLAAGLFLGVALAAYLLAIAATAVGEDVGWAATTALRADLVAHCLGLDLGFHHAHTPGELIERVDGDVQALAHLFSRLVLHVCGNLLLLAGILVALWRTDWRVGAAFTPFVGGALLILTRLRAVGVAAWRAAREANAALFGFVEERLAGLVDLRANGATGYVLQRFTRAQQMQFAAEVGAWRRAAPPQSALGVLFALATALGLGLGGWLARRGDLTIGVVTMIYAYTTTLFAPLARLGQAAEQLQTAGANILRVDELVQMQSALQDGTVALPEGALAVTFAGVSFGYDPATPVLHDLSFHLAAGRSLGLLGRTGSGKTTITRLLLRLYDPQAGAVCLGGRDLRTVREAALRQRVGVVTQDVQLFAASVRDNLTMFDQTIPDDRLLAALDDLGLGAWRRALPAGLDTVLLPGGDGGLSAGEAQLLAFARVFLRDPGLVILDEASARLDPATEARLAHAVDRLLAGRTAIVIAHRLATVQRVDDMLILADGRIREQGPRAALAADPTSTFARLLRTSLAEVLA